MIWQQDALLALRVLIAAVLGGLIGWQREHVGIEAGVRTFAAVSLGACAFGLISQIQTGDTRISTQIVSSCPVWPHFGAKNRSEEHTSELHSLAYLVCRL